jgi:hypothetical protein
MLDVLSLLIQEETYAKLGSRETAKVCDKVRHILQGLDLLVEEG